MKALVIGATGVAGAAAIDATRQRYPDAHITALWFGKPDPDLHVGGANATLFGDITEPEVMDAIREAGGEDFDWLFYATALGDVGFPINEASDEQIAQSNRLSFDPILALQSQFNIGNIVAYSTFYNLPHQRVMYGAMGHSKAGIEQWAVAQGGPSRHWVIRAGAFTSASSQGIKLLVRRRAKALAESDDPLLSTLFKDRKPSEAIELLAKAVADEETELLGDSGTDAQSLVQAHLAVFDQPNDSIINVCGNKIWTSNTALSLTE